MHTINHSRMHYYLNQISAYNAGIYCFNVADVASCYLLESLGGCCLALVLRGNTVDTGDGVLGNLSIFLKLFLRFPSTRTTSLLFRIFLLVSHPIIKPTPSRAHSIVAVVVAPTYARLFAPIFHVWGHLTIPPSELCLLAISYFLWASSSASCSCATDMAVLQSPLRITWHWSILPVLLPNQPFASV